MTIDNELEEAAYEMETSLFDEDSHPDLLREAANHIRAQAARIAALTKDAERLKCFNQIWRWKALKDGEIIYQYGEHVPALFQKTAELLPAHPPAPQPDAEPVAWNIYSKNGEELLFLEQNKDSAQRRIDAGYVVKPCYEGNPPAHKTITPDCVWKYDLDLDMYDTGCNEAFVLSEGSSLEEHKIKFCPFCGGHIVNGASE